MTHVQRRYSLGRTAVVFALICGLVGEAAELALLARGGIEAPGLRLRLTLLAVYASVGALLYLAAAAISGDGARRLRFAATAFGALLLLPLLNFDYLPQLFTWQTILGNLVALVVLAATVHFLVRLPRLTGLVCVLLALIVNLSGPRAPATTANVGRAVDPARRPINVVLVLIDTLRADHLGAYGYERPTSPNIDRLGRDGVVFERASSQATYTKPAVASLLTGTFVHRHGVISSRDALGPELPTLAEALHGYGYRTAAFSANPWITPEFRFQRGFDHFESNRAIDVQLTVLYRLLRRLGAVVKERGGNDFSRWLLRVSGEPNPSNSRRDEILTESVISWLEKNNREPFFVYAHLIGPHDPYDPPAESLRQFRDMSWDGTPARTRPPERVLSAFETAKPLEPAARDMMVAQYNGAIAFADGLVGRIAATLEQLGVQDRTLLVITSDHGEEFYEHGNWGHGVRLYQEIVHVPLLFRLPEALKPARRADAAMLIDIFPTICGLTGIGCDANQLNGRDLFAAAPADGAVGFSEYFSVEGGSYVSRMAIREGLKLIETHDEARGQRRLELFDLHSDPDEQRNVLSSAEVERGDEVAALKGALSKFASTTRHRQAPAVELDEKTRDALHNLGYGGLDQH